MAMDSPLWGEAPAGNAFGDLSILNKRAKLTSAFRRHINWSQAFDF